MKIPKISVIMSVYNGEKFLKEAIDSILNQTFTDFEFIIVNDGSSDNSLDILQSYNDDRIRIINNKKNIGLTKSLNKALKKAKGEYIARQDADDISLTERFEKQMKFFENNPNVVLLGTNVYFIDKEGNIVVKYSVIERPTLDDFVVSNQLVHGSAIFRKEIINKVGAYNEQMFYSQDYEFWIRIAMEYEIRNLKEILYKLRNHGENVRIINSEYPILYNLFAKKKAKGDLNNINIKIKEKKDIKNLYKYLDKNEKIIFHKSVAHLFSQNKEQKKARKEYKIVFHLNPFDINNCLNFLISFLSDSAINQSYKFHTRLYNVKKSLKLKYNEYLKY